MLEVVTLLVVRTGYDYFLKLHTCFVLTFVMEVLWSSALRRAVECLRARAGGRGRNTQGTEVD